MVRLKLFRLLLTVLLALVGVLLWVSWEPRSPVRGTPRGATNRDGPRYEGVSVKRVEGSAETVAGDAAVIEPGAGNSLHLSGIRNLEFERPSGGPVIVDALRGDREGEQGARKWRFADEVVFREPGEGLLLRMPFLEIDETAGLARSQGHIDFEAARFRGSTASVVYGMRGQPAELGPIDIQDDTGGNLSANRAIFRDGAREIELLEDVHVLQRGREVTADRVRLARPENRLRHLEATGNVRGRWETVDRPASLEGEQLDIFWNAVGKIDRWVLEGTARLRQVEQTLTAQRVEAAEKAQGGYGWIVRASGEVLLRGQFGDGPGTLRAESLDAVLGSALELEGGVARGRVNFESATTRAEAEQATLHGGTRAGQLLLGGVEGRQARLAHERMRVVAREIRTDLRGRKLEAEGKVEATLLPADFGPAPSGRIFFPGQAVHFVSARLESENGGARLAFSGAVRGWQGERNLSGETVIVNQETDTLEARGSVTSRLPRRSDDALLTEAAFVQITADELHYRNSNGTGVYRGHVRMLLAEGWMEAEQLEIELAKDRRIHEVRASGWVRLEISQDTAEPESAPLTGTADRVVYSPEESAMRLYGDQSPAIVRRFGGGGGTTTGRVLRYQLNTRALVVDSGDQGLARIRTSEQ